MKIAYFPNHIAQNGAPVLDAFLASCQSRGIACCQDDHDADAAVIWSTLWAGRMKANREVWQNYRPKRPVIVLEVGGLSRGETWRIGINGVNGSACFGVQGNGPARAQELGLTLHPWRASGSKIVICLQRSDSQQWHAMPDMRSWVRDTIHEIRKYTDRPIVIRPHPRQRVDLVGLDAEIDLPKQIMHTYDDFDFPRTLSDAWAVVCWSSNPGWQSILAGVPAFVGPDSLAGPMGTWDFSCIENPIMPDRQQWLNDLAYCEWRLDEIRRGLPLDRLLNDLAC